MSFFTPYNLLEKDVNNIFIKREDLIPYAFGGNKYRIAQEYIYDMKSKEKNCMVAYGNPRSNLCRVLAMMCCSQNIPCYILSPDEGDGTRVKSFNKYLAELCSAKIVNCDKHRVSESVKNVLNKILENGLKPYYIYGDEFGKGNESVPIKAYYNLYNSEINMFVNENKIEYIFLPLGTGMTIAGLALGNKENCGLETIVGISVARTKKEAYDGFNSFYYSFEKYNDNYSNPKIKILDDYIMGGYGLYNDELTSFINETYCKYGISMDPTYVGKAFFGMNRWIKDNNIINSNILFIHTGGIPIWFDYLLETMEDK